MRQRAANLRHLSLITLSALLLSLSPAHAVRAAVPPLPDESALTDPKFAREGHADIATPFMQKTRYLIALDVGWATGKISGQARILYVNSTPDTLQKIEFRLYPNHPPTPLEAGSIVPSKPRMLMQTVTVDGAAVHWATRDAYQSVLDVPLDTPLAPGGQVQIDASYTVTYGIPVDELDGLENFPMLAVYENGAWREDISTKGLDYIFSETALYAVTIRAPNDAALYAVGTITNTDVDGKSVIYHITTGPVRDFIYVLTKGWGYLADTSGPVPIDVHYRGSLAAAQEETTIAARAMTYYDSHFGVYPYAHLTMLDLVFPSGGIQYPTLLFNDNERDTNYRRFITAHEVAHQWFYAIVGNDPLHHAWMDESLAQISLYLFYRDVYGSDVAEAEWTHILTWSNRAPKTPRPIDTPVMRFTDFNDYMSHTYGLGAVFMRDLAERIGYTQFVAGLSLYYQKAFLSVGTPQQFYDAMQQQAPSIALAPIFCAKLGTQCA